VAVTLNAATGIVYVDGVAVGTNSSMSLNPASLGSTTNNYIGRSQSGSEAYLSGALDEFRIYSEALSPAEIAATAALGPDHQLSTNSPHLSLELNGSDLTLSWPLASAGFALQARTNFTAGEWMDVSSPAPGVSGADWRVTLPQPADSSVFYRLVK
jgi:hypothetical protein